MSVGDVTELCFKFICILGLAVFKILNLVSRLYCTPGACCGGEGKERGKLVGKILATNRRVANRRISVPIPTLYPLFATIPITRKRFKFRGTGGIILISNTGHWRIADLGQLKRFSWKCIFILALRINLHCSGK